MKLLSFILLSLKRWYLVIFYHLETLTAKKSFPTAQAGTCVHVLLDKNNNVIINVYITVHLLVSGVRTHIQACASTSGCILTLSLEATAKISGTRKKKKKSVNQIDWKCCIQQELQ